MANEPVKESAGAVNNLIETVGKLGQQQVELITNGIKSASAVVEPLTKTSIELVGNVVNALNQALQNISAAVGQKK